MKLSKEALLEIMSIVQIGFLEGKDVSQMLRDLDLDEELDPIAGSILVLSPQYLKTHPRGA